MRNLDLDLRLLAAIVILALGATRVNAQYEFNKGLDFRPGGQTIGGPGLAEMQAGEIGGDWSSDEPAAVCITVANVGSSLVVLTRTVGFVIRTPVPPGTTRTLCNSNTELLFLNCEPDSKTPGAPKCIALWRVDEYHPSSKINP